VSRGIEVFNKELFHVSDDGLINDIIPHLLSILQLGHKHLPVLSKILVGSSWRFVVRTWVFKFCVHIRSLNRDGKVEIFV
jgi:hypothetical protein